MGSDGSRVRQRKGGVTKGLRVWSRVGPRSDGVTRRLVDVALVRPGGVTRGHVWSEDVTMGHGGGGEGMDSARSSRW